MATKTQTDSWKTNSAMVSAFKSSLNTLYRSREKLVKAIFSTSLTVPVFEDGYLETSHIDILLHQVDALVDVNVSIASFMDSLLTGGHDDKVLALREYEQQIKSLDVARDKLTAVIKNSPEEIVYAGGINRIHVDENLPTASKLLIVVNDKYTENMRGYILSGGVWPFEEGVDYESP